MFTGGGVGHREAAVNDEDAIDTLRNLGPTSAGWLREVGVATVTAANG